MNFSKLLPLFFLSLFIFSSCSDEENGPQIQPDAIEGEWLLNDMDYDSDTYMVIEGQQTKTSDVIGEITESNMIYTFSSNPNDVSVTGSYTMDLSITPIGFGDTMTETVTVNNVDGLNSNWRIEGNTFYTTDDQGVETGMEILKLNDNEFVLKGDFQYEQSDDFFQGVMVRTDVFITIYFTRP